MKITSSTFIKSIAHANDIINDNLPQVAFVGRSNVGKSSLLNYLVNNNKLAKTSSTPGRTRLINYFLINKNFYFVDLPGYGFQKGNKLESADWHVLIEPFLISNTNLKCICLLVDGRHEPFDSDKQMLNYLSFYNIPFIIIATKCDKIPKSKQFSIKNNIAKVLSMGKDDIFLSSSISNLGKLEILTKLNQLIGVN
mgnify:CR=1 FL=1